MAMAAACCLSPSPPTPRLSNPPSSSSSSSSSSSTSASSSMAPRTIQVAWGRNERGQPGRPSGAARVAVTVIGLVGMGGSFAGLGEVTEAAESLRTAARRTGEVATAARWSEKRSCPPWQLNSLETIVPENLPRPHAHRKSESVGLSDRRDAPALKARAAKSNPGCFSM